MSKKPKSGWKTASTSTHTDKVEEKMIASMPGQVEKPVSSFDEDSERKDRHSRRTNAVDPLTSSLGAKGYDVNKRWDWLFFMFGGARYNLSVDRFYIEYSLAVDLKKPEKEEYLVDVKRELCVDNGIKYFYCRNSDELEQMVSEVLSAARGIQ